MEVVQGEPRGGMEEEKERERIRSGVRLKVRLGGEVRRCVGASSTRQAVDVAIGRICPVRHFRDDLLSWTCAASVSRNVSLVARPSCNLNEHTPSNMLSRLSIATRCGIPRLSCSTSSCANSWQARRWRSFQAFDANLDQEALAEARDWFSKFDESALPKGSTTYTRSQGPGGQHVNKSVCFSTKFGGAN